MNKNPFPRAKTQEEKTTRSKQILSAAKKTFLLNGIEKTTLEQIASEAKLSRSLIYKYYTDKEDILTSLAVKYGWRLAYSMESSIDNNRSGRETVERLIDAFFNFFLDNQKEYQFYENQIISIVQKDDSKKGDTEREFEKVEQHIYSLFHNALNKGIYNDHSLAQDNPDSPLYITSYVYGAIHGIASTQSMLLNTLNASHHAASSTLKEAKNHLLSSLIDGSNQ